jgi:hypothetical protein
VAELVMRALRELWAVLSPLGFPMAVMGGIAVSLWKHVRATQDVDLLIGAGPAEEASMIEALQRAGFRVKRDPPILALGEFRLLQLLYEPPGSHLEIQVDLLIVSSEYHLQALARRVLVPLPELGIEVAVLKCEDLILHKLLAGRILDRADVGALLRANLATLDRPYLVEWAESLCVQAELVQVWAEAVPGEPLYGNQ